MDPKKNVIFLGDFGAKTGRENNQLPLLFQQGKGNRQLLNNLIVVTNPIVIKNV